MPAQIYPANTAFNGNQLFMVAGAQNGYVAGQYGIPPTDAHGLVDNEAFVRQQHELLRRQYPGIIFPGENMSRTSSNASSQ
mmetsp:Transcript_16611/g.39751  ORF Transcript_16611/g.39751 Transcript_16611/m.39751 type:complete len:81 (+) Transcript_16611:37-279(+)